MIRHDTPPTELIASDKYAEIAQEILPADRVLLSLLKRGAEKFGDKILMTCGAEKWTFHETERIARAWAKRLAAAGITAGDRVAIHSSNRVEFLQIYLGCALLGAIAAPINTAFRGAQLAHVVNNASPQLLVVEKGYEKIYADLPAETHRPALVWWLGEDGIKTAEGMPVIADGDDLTIIAPNTKPSDTVAILYTSGTTGPSKGVCCPQAQMFWWGIYSGRALGVREGDVLMTTLPIFHTNALNTFYQALLIGCEFVLLPKFSASQFWDDARDCGATVAYLLGAMASILMSPPPRDSDKQHKIRVALGGGVPAPKQIPFYERFGVPLVDGYASTETNFVFYTSAPADPPGTMGHLSPAAEAIVVDEYEQPLPQGEIGELLLRPTEPFSFATGYFEMSQKTAEAQQNYWFHTGDRVVQETAGHYRFVDRVKDSIRRRGENISSWEVEQVFQAYPAVKACAAYALPSELGEDDVAVAIQLADDHGFEPLELIKFAETRLAYFAVPRYLRVVKEMPLTENGKVKKVTLREDGKTADTWDLETTGYKVKR